MSAAFVPPLRPHSIAAIFAVIVIGDDRGPKVILNGRRLLMPVAPLDTAYRRTAPNRLVFFATAALAFVGFVATTPAVADGPFAALAGTWSGMGTVKLTNGASERLRCKGYYINRDGGSGLGMSIRCASAANKFNLRANIVSNGGSVSGDWTETNYNATGGLSGSANASKIALRINGGITGTMAVTVSGSSQRVVFSSTDPNAFKGLNISFSR